MLMADRRLIAVGDYGVPVGEHHPKARLSDADVDRIRELHEESGFSYGVLAIMFNTPKDTIAHICQYRRRTTTAVAWRAAKRKDAA